MMKMTTHDEDVSKLNGNTYDVCAYHKKSLTQVMQYRNKKTNEGLNIKIMETILV